MVFYTELSVMKGTSRQETWLQILSFLLSLTAVKYHATLTNLEFQLSHCKLCKRSSITAVFRNRLENYYGKTCGRNINIAYMTGLYEL